MRVDVRLNARRLILDNSIKHDEDAIAPPRRAGACDVTSDSISTADDDGRSFWRDVVVAFGLSLGAAVALGFSRFSYGLLLPPMRADLAWTYVEAGALNTANGVGYIAGALVAAWTARRWGPARAFIGGFVVSVAVLLLTAASTRLAVLFALRTVGGLSTALTFIVGAGLASAICPTQHPRRRGGLVGLYVAGVSIGVLLAGIAVPLVLRGGVQHWPEGWLALGLMSALALPAAAWAARQVPAPSGGGAAVLRRGELRQLAPTLIGYGLFGAGYVGYMTFIMALLQDQGGSSGQLAGFWLVLALVSAVSTLLWGRALAGLHDGRGAAIVFATAMLGTLPVLLWSGPVAMFVSAVLFGGSYLAGPTSITLVAQRQLPAASWTAAISLLTVGFALGQAIGPVLAGAISDATGSIAAGFWVSPLLLGVAACVNLLQRPPSAASQ
ncbi:MAG: YbfB/YjiJ family MFS transporter [Burkholderiaceae bacterium]